MPITTLGVGAAVTPTVVKTYLSHYANRKPRHQKPTAHISYDEGLHLIRTFLKYASHHTVDELQTFTARWVPTPSWVRTENVTIAPEHVFKAAQAIIDQLGSSGVEQVGGTQWWQWRQSASELKAEWIEMRAHYNEHKRRGSESRRIMLYVHGGGYFFGSVDEHRYQLQRHARKLKARVLAPRYRLAPQFPFPCGLQDCLAAYLYLLSLHDHAEIILAGDSAGGGMVVSMLCLCRDRGLPMPAGAILISPWVDLTHSFPSLSASDEFDYIPPYGFMHKPSPTWPPPNEEEASIIRQMAQPQQAASGARQSQQEDPASTASLVSSVLQKGPAASDDPSHMSPGSSPLQSVDEGPTRRPGPLSIEIDGQRVLLHNQFQMYTTNQLLTHPLVSPVLQPSLGGLPPVLILTGGGEILRDEQIYLAHKMANPAKYPLGSAYRSVYDPNDAILDKYRATPVQLQVWEDLCHVAPTLSFTRPAKYMYRSIAQFGAWVLAKAQRRAIEIMDDDNISVISSHSSSDLDEGAETLGQQKVDVHELTGSVGRAGDPIPPFQNHMIRQRIDRYGRIYPLADASQLPATQMSPDQVGVINVGPVRKWLEARQRWDTKYAPVSRRVRKERVQALAGGEIREFGNGECPPPSAMAGRRTNKDLLPRKPRKSYGLAMWSMWGSKHDESTLKREEEALEREKTHSSQGPADDTLGTGKQVDGAPTPERLATFTSRRKSGSRTRSTSGKRRASETQAGTRRRTISVTDTGQTEEGRDLPRLAVSPEADGEAISEKWTTTSPSSPPQKKAPSTASATTEAAPLSPDTSLLSAGFMPKFKTASHLREDSGGLPASDTASVMTGRSAILADDASTRAVFAAPGVVKSLDDQDQQHRMASGTTPTLRGRTVSPLITDARSFVSDGESVDDRHVFAAFSGLSPTGALGALGSDTPRSRRSLDRLQSHQHDEEMGHVSLMRSPSSTAVVRMEGVVGLIESNGDNGASTPRADGPDRALTAPVDADAVKEKETDTSWGSPLVNGVTATEKTTIESVHNADGVAQAHEAN